MIPYDTEEEAVEIANARLRVGLVLVSPNMTYPKVVKATAQGVVNAAPAREAKLTADLAAAPDDTTKAKLQKALDGVAKDVAVAKANLDKFKNDETSIVGLEKPLFECAIRGSCRYRSASSR